MDERRVILVDLDSTVHEYMHTVALVALNDYGIRIESPVDDWAGVFPKDTPADIQVEIFNRCHDKEYINLTKPYPGAVDTLQHIHGLDFDIWYLTDRKKEARADTAAWLLEHDFPVPEQLICSRDKRALIDRWGDAVLAVIDDRPRTMIHARYNAGISTVFSLRHEYNKNLTDVPGIYIHEHWDGIWADFERLFVDEEENSGELADS